MWWTLLLNFLLLLQYIHVFNQDFITSSTPTRTYTYAHAFYRKYLFTVQAQNVSCLMLLLFLFFSFYRFSRLDAKSRKRHKQNKIKKLQPSKLRARQGVLGLCGPILSLLTRACLLASVDSILCYNPESCPRMPGDRWSCSAYVSFDFHQNRILPCML